jgi:putative oxidoreductase
MIYNSRAFETYAPVVARVAFGLQFLLGAFFKMPGTAGFPAEVAMTAATGWPFATLSVALAFVLEVCAGLALVFGWHTRAAAFILALFTLLLAFVFYRHVSDPMIMGMFISHLAFIAGLLYVSVYGAKAVALKRD